MGTNSFMSYKSDCKYNPTPIFSGFATFPYLTIDILWRRERFATEPSVASEYGSLATIRSFSPKYPHYFCSTAIGLVGTLHFDYFPGYFPSTFALLTIHMRCYELAKRGAVVPLKTIHILWRSYHKRCVAIFPVSARLDRRAVTPELFRWMYVGYSSFFRQI